MSPEERRLRNKRVASLLKHPKTPQRLITESKKRWGYTESDTRRAWLALECRFTPTFRLRLPRENEEAIWDWS